MTDNVEEVSLIHEEKTASNRKVLIQKEADSTRGTKEDVSIREKESIKNIYAQNITETAETSWTTNVD